MSVSDPPSCVRQVPKYVGMSKDPVSICRKRVNNIGITAGGVKTRKDCRQEKQQLGIAFPGKAARISRAFHWDKKGI